MFNNSVESLDEVSFKLGTFLNIEQNIVCVFFAGSVIFINADNVSKAFVFVTDNLEMTTRYIMIEILRDKQSEV